MKTRVTLNIRGHMGHTGAWQDVCVCVYCVCKRTRVCLVLGALQRLEFTLHESVKTKTESGDRKGKDTDGGMNTAG